MMGVHNPRTGTLTLHSAPVHAFSTSVKQLKSTPGIVSASLMGAQRALLGATFGTKKAIRSINADARNKLTHESYGVGKETQGLMAESITIGAASLPIKSVIEATADLARPIPPPNFDAQTPDEVYDMDDVVTPIELECINIDPFLMARSYKERSNLLPFRHSKFINTRLKNLLPTPEGLAEDEPIPLRNKDKKRLRYLIHISYLMAFRSAASGGRASSLERSNLLERLGSPAPVIIDALLDRYTELQRSGTSHEAKVTGTMEIKLMGYLMILVLKVDKFGTDVGVIAEDLKLPPKRFVPPDPCTLWRLTADHMFFFSFRRSLRAQELFRSLGCVLLAPSSEERNALVSSGVAATNAEARSSKRAVLRVPLVFPKETRGQPKR